MALASLHWHSSGRQTLGVSASAWQGWRPHRHRSSLRRPVDLGQAWIHSPLTTVKQELLLFGYSRQLASVRSGHWLVHVVSAGRSQLLMRCRGWVARTRRAACNERDSVSQGPFASFSLCHTSPQQTCRTPQYRAVIMTAFSDCHWRHLRRTKPRAAHAGSADMVVGLGPKLSRGSTGSTCSARA